MLGTTDPNELLCRRVIHANDESPNVTAGSTCREGAKAASPPRAPSTKATPAAPAIPEPVYLLLLIDHELVAHEQVRFTAIRHLANALGGQLGINGLLDLGVQDLVGTPTHRGHALYLIDPCISAIFGKISSRHIVG